MSDQKAYQREDLEEIFASCIVMTTLDGEIHLDELKPAVSFVESRWQGEYGDINDLMMQARESAGEILDSPSLSKSIGSIAESLAGSLDQDQKNEILELLKVVLHADGEAHDMEHGMYEIFASKFQG